MQTLTGTGISCSTEACSKTITDLPAVHAMAVWLLHHGAAEDAVSSLILHLLLRQMLSESLCSPRNFFSIVHEPAMQWHKCNPELIVSSCWCQKVRAN